MIQEQYVSSKTAKLLREKEFPIGHPEVCTQALVMRWLREAHNIMIQLCFHPCKTDWGWYFHIIQTGFGDGKGFKGFPVYKTHNTYEEACEAAIKYCFENLI